MTYTRPGSFSGGCTSGTFNFSEKQWQSLEEADDSKRKKLRELDEKNRQADFSAQGIIAGDYVMIKRNGDGPWMKVKPNSTDSECVLSADQELKVLKIVNEGYYVEATHKSLGGTSCRYGHKFFVEQAQMRKWFNFVATRGSPERFGGKCYKRNHGISYYSCAKVPSLCPVMLGRYRLKSSSWSGSWSGGSLNNEYPGIIDFSAELNFDLKVAQFCAYSDLQQGLNACLTTLEVSCPAPLEGSETNIHTEGETGHGGDAQ